MTAKHSGGRTAPIIVATAGAALLAVTTMAGSTTAATKDDYKNAYAQCRKGGDKLVAWVEYRYSPQNTLYIRKAGFHIEGNNKPHNNIYMALRGDGGEKPYWYWQSKDLIKGGQPYEKKVDKRVSRTRNPYMKVHATFDQVGPDPQCPAYVKLPRSA
jgi:hypothetical protein